MECVNLKERFGKRFKVRYEESRRADRGDGARLPDPWLMILLCQRGHIFPWGGDRLAASTDSPGATARKLAALPGAILHQDGADGMTVVFDVADFAAVAALMHPRRRRQMTEAQRAAATERLAKYAFRPGCKAPETSAVCVGRV